MTLITNIFTNNAFNAIEVTRLVDDLDYVPSYLGSLQLFEPVPLVTTTVGVMKKSGGYTLVPITERGAPPKLIERHAKNLRHLPTVRLALEERITAASLQNVLSDSAPLVVNLTNALTEVAERQQIMMNNIELTKEYHRLAALQGLVLDADGSEFLDFNDEFGVTPAATYSVPLLDPTANLRALIAQNIVRPMMRALKGKKTSATRIGAIVGDEFFDNLVTHAQVERTYLNYQAAAELRQGTTQLNVFRFAGVEWYNYIGTDDNTTVAIADDEAKFFPIGARDVFKAYWAPGEQFGETNQKGRPLFSYVSPDPRPNMAEWVDVHMRSYPLYACIAPEVLRTGDIAAAAP